MYNSSLDLIETDEKRSIIVVGKTGAGKSKLLNELMDKFIFKSSAETTSCTNEVKQSGWHQVDVRKDRVGGDWNISFKLNTIDTPGISDSQGRSKKFLNEIAQTIKTTPLNLIIVLVEYGRIDVGLQNNLEVLRECLNDLSQSSSMLIINKVPTERTLKNKRRNHEQCRDRTEVLDETFKTISEKLGSTFKYKLFLENDESDEGEDNNKKKYNLIKLVTFVSATCVNTEKVRTWDEIVQFYDTNNSDQIYMTQMNELKRELEDKLDKIEWDIADYKYPFVHEINRNKNIISASDYKFFSNFECSKTLQEQRNHELLGHSNILFQMKINYIKSYIFDINSFDQLKNYIRKNLEQLDLKRNQLKHQLLECEGTIHEQENIIELKKEKIMRLKTALESPYQI